MPARAESVIIKVLHARRTGRKAGRFGGGMAKPSMASAGRPESSELMRQLRLGEAAAMDPTKVMVCAEATAIKNLWRHSVGKSSPERRRTVSPHRKAG